MSKEKEVEEEEKRTVPEMVKDQAVKHVEKKIRKKTRRARLAVKVLLITLGVGAVCGAAAVLGVHGMIKKVFVNEKWPDEEWSSDDWAEEELES